MNIDKALQSFESYLEDSVKDNVPEDFSDIGMLKYDIKTHRQMLITINESIRSVEADLKDANSRIDSLIVALNKTIALCIQMNSNVKYK